MNEQIIFALDEFLDFPIHEPTWLNFFRKHNIVIKNYDDMGLLTNHLKEKDIGISYLPVANYYHLKDDPRYVPIASALTGKSGSAAMDVVLVVKKDSPYNKLADLQNLDIGYIHPYCTTSYFGLILLLQRNGFSINNFFNNIVEVGAWQKQIDAVVAGEVAATVVYRDVWLKNVDNAQNTRVIDELDGLPTPLIIVHKSLAKEIVIEFFELLNNHKMNGISLFNGFIPYDRNRVENIFSSIDKQLVLEK
ncbi:phosphate/phosphite/phosphonate ABC transporter substrate-binding protein [Aquella oligotrophica]|uniref:Uncharacterized protein n=1 Tax=Aquella oligotrophica TaxID=2067065 RepID=A0A2I7N749_9NEIS|nr:PhnD/SsuA/transferrin family substrate-binding protein [Aquella oligotrophica]AUR52271.1 hypothetical protein CUN60_08175 [Aquella oligotrophica]